MSKKKWIDDEILKECTVCSLHQYICHLHGNDYVFNIFENDDCFEVWLNRFDFSFMDYVLGYSKVQTDLDGSEYEFTIDRLLDKLNYHCHSFCDKYDDYVSKIVDFNAYAPGHFYE